MRQRVAGAVKARAAHAGPGHSADSAAPLQALTQRQQDLETQNQELRRVQGELSAACARYRDLFDNAPVGYLTLDAGGCVIEANQTAASMLAEPDTRLTGCCLSAWLSPADAERWHRHCRHALQQRCAQPIELKLQRRSGGLVHGRLDCLAIASGTETPRLHVAITDLAPSRQADADRLAVRRVLAAQEGERRRVARALHDDLGQRLSLAKMELAAWLPEAPAPHPLAPLLGALDEAVAIVRRMAAQLRPLMLDDLGLCAAIETLARDAARQSGLRLELSLATELRPLDEQNAVILYRVLQQALCLVAQAPGVRVVGVSLVDQADSLVMTVYSRLDGRRRVMTADAGGTRWSALRDAGPLLGYTLAHDLRPGGERISVRLAAVAPGNAGR